MNFTVFESLFLNLALELTSKKSLFGAQAICESIYIYIYTYGIIIHIESHR